VPLRNCSLTHSLTFLVPAYSGFPREKAINRHLLAAPALCASMYMLGARPSVCLSVSVQATAAKFAIVARPAGDIDRLLHGAQQRGVRRANAGSATLSAYEVIIIITITATMLRCYHHDESHCESSHGSCDECRLSAGWPPTLRPSQSTWAASPPKIGSYHPHAPSPLLLSLSPYRLILILAFHGRRRAEHAVAIHRLVSVLK